MTPLHYAARYGAFELVKILVKNILKIIFFLKISSGAD